MADSIMMSDSLKDIWEGPLQESQIKVTSPLQGSFLGCGTKNNKKYYSFITDNIFGAFDLLNGTKLKNFIINYGEKELCFNLESPDIDLEYLALTNKIKVVLMLSNM